MKFRQIAEGLGQEADIMEQDHEVQMARADCFNAAKNAIELHRLLKNISEQQGLEGWVSEKITLAADYLSTVKEYLEYEMISKVETSLPNKNPDDYNEMFSQYMGESKTKKIKPIVEDEKIKSPEEKITTPGLNAIARELLIKAYGKFPEAKNDISVIINYLAYLENRGGSDIKRLDKENRQQDIEIDDLEVQNQNEIQEISALKQLIQNYERKALAKTMAPPPLPQSQPPAAPMAENKKSKKQIMLKDDASGGASAAGGIGASAVPNLFAKPVKRTKGKNEKRV